MNLEELRKSLVQEAKAEAKRVTGKAESEAANMIEEAMEKAAKIVEEAREKAKRAAEAEKKERLGAAQLRARRITSEAQNIVIQQGLDKVWKEFSSTPENRQEYGKLLKRLVTGAEREIGKGAVVHVNPRDLATARKLSKNLSKDGAEIAGGAIITSGDGSIIINNSLEALFSSREDELKKLIYAEIFGGRKK